MSPLCLLSLSLAVASPEPIADPDPILDDWPAYVDPIAPGDYDRYRDDPIVQDIGADLLVRAWRWSDALGGVLEAENRLRSDATALILVHPWGIDDGQGWGWPQAYNAYGYVFEGLYDDNQLYLQHVDEVVRPLVDGLRGRLPVVVASLPGVADPLRTRRYRSFEALPSASERAAAQVELEATLAALSGADWPDTIPVVAGLEIAPDDVVNYDDEGFAALRADLEALGVEHVLLAGWATDMCVMSTTAGFQQLATAFDVFLIGDATLAAWPRTPAPPNGYVPVSTLAALMTASTEEQVAITQGSWLTLLDRDPAGAPSWRGEAGSWVALFDHWQARPAESSPDRDQTRAPDWASSGAPTLLGAGFDADGLALSGLVSGRVNAIAVPEGLPMTLSLGFEEGLEGLELQVVARWAPALEGQELVVTLTGGEELALEVLSERDEGAGWRLSTFGGSVAGAEEMSLTLAFSAGQGWLDSVAIDGRPRAAEAADSGQAVDTAPPEADSGPGDSAPVEDSGAPADSGVAEAGPAKAGGCGCASGGGSGSLGLLGLGLLAARRPRRASAGGR